MYERDRYLTDAANKTSNWFEKPLAIIATMAFLFAWTFAALIFDIPMVGYVIVNTLITTIILLTVLRLQYTHDHDIRSLQARVNALAAEIGNAGKQADAGTLSDAELQQVRGLLQQNQGDDAVVRRSNRDHRPSLF